ncbi:MAG: ATP-binding protein, partial [Planctomycetota bacterium]
RRLVRKTDIALNEELDENGLPLLGDAIQLQQVFVNLITNAVQAMPDGGALGVRTEKRLDRSGRALVAVEIRDNGVGMTPDVLDKAFDPFFSTKPLGEGTGLGLAVSRSIVESHDGEITAESSEGGGTVFTVLMPALQELETDAPDAEQQNPAEPLSQQKAGTEEKPEEPGTEWRKARKTPATRHHREESGEN